jgi:3-oxoacyl-[acyl-carrier protein] reductase
VARTVVVSGGGTGIGREVAARFAAQGDDVVIVGRRADVLDRVAKDLGGTVTPVVADLAEADGAARVRDLVAERYGRVDVLVNSAGGNVQLGGDEPPAGLAGVAWHWVGNFRSNVLTAVLLTEALADLYADPGRIVLVSSIAAYRGSGSGSYGGAKAALHPYAFDLAARLGPRGVTVNVVAPGYIEETEFFAGSLSDERRRTLIGQTFDGRPGTVGDVASTVQWLCSPEAGHITAQIVQINGGALLGR